MPDDMELRAHLANQNRHMGRDESGGIGMRHDGGEVELLHEGHDDLSVLNQKGCGDIQSSSYGRRCLLTIGRSASLGRPAAGSSDRHCSLSRSGPMGPKEGTYLTYCERDSFLGLLP